MDLTQLKTFVAVAEEQHLTRAAERLFTSQPAVSAQLKALEDTLGLPLFERTPKGMRLTPAGERLLPQALAILDSAKQLVNQARALQGTLMGELNIGINSDFSFLRLDQLLRDSREAYPQLQLSFMSSMSADILQDLRRGKLDAGFFFGPCNFADLSVEALSEIEMALIAPASWAEQIRSADLSRLCRMPWVYSTRRCPFFVISERLFAGMSEQPEKVVFVDNEEAIRTLVKAESGIALMRGDDADRAVAEGWGVRWPGKVPDISLSVATQANRRQEQNIQAFLRLLRDCWPEAEGPSEAKRLG
ncbi:MAG: LysR family transcriptional regulator [Hahellaceae bacterium]|nr:LysR family transcriptional regulator [Hahellaceae bacterium]